MSLKNVKEADCKKKLMNLKNNMYFEGGFNSWLELP